MQNFDPPTHLSLKMLDADYGHEYDILQLHIYCQMRLLTLTMYSDLVTRQEFERNQSDSEKMCV